MEIFGRVDRQDILNVLLAVWMQYGDKDTLEAVAQSFGVLYEFRNRREVRHVQLVGETQK